MSPSFVGVDLIIFRGEKEERLNQFISWNKEIPNATKRDEVIEKKGIKLGSFI